MAMSAFAVGLKEDLSLGVYLKEISAIPLLTPDQEKKLGKRVRTRKDKRAMDQLVRSNLRFVVHLAKNYVNRGLSLADLIHEGNLGLIRAAQGFDDRRGVRFISYAQWWIRQCILLAIARQSRIIRLPMNKEGMLNKAHKLGTSMRETLGRDPTIGEIADELKVPERELQETMNLANFHLSLDSSEGTDGEQALANFIPEEEIPLPDEKLIEKSMRWDVRRAIGDLSDRESKILRLYFGVESERSHTLEEIGGEFGLSKERVRQIKERALDKLKKGTDAMKLASYLN